ncbi:MAG: hypothetical protein ABEH64_03280 [Salinirussus sp.]
MMDYYDLVLGLIPLSLAGISGVLVATGMALTLAIPLAGVIAIALIGHAMFVRTPVSEATPSAPSGRNAGFETAD